MPTVWCDWSVKIPLSLMLRCRRMDLKYVSTKALVEELVSREAVEKTVIEPYEKYSITVGEDIIKDSGPVVLLKIWD